MFEVGRFLARRWALGIADAAVTMPLLRWTWRGIVDDKFSHSLPEFRPTDQETIIEMMQGRYLLASKLVDTHGGSPFTVDIEHDDWQQSLHSFSWLRHFRDARDSGTRGFARMLVLDWIGHNGHFDHELWAPALCAQRVLNWLRHYSLLVEGATPEQAARIARALGGQIQSLKVRARLCADPVGALLAHAALVGAALCRDRSEEVEASFDRMMGLLHGQVDADGLHLSRSPKVQLTLLVELISIRKGLGRGFGALANRLGAVLDPMHQVLDALTLGSGEPAYFNGCGQLPHDIVVAVQAESVARQRGSVLAGGYGLLMSGPAQIVADSGAVPPLAFAGEATASALAFEFSHGQELIFGSCGPAPAELPGSKPLFRRGIAHSGPTINAISAATYKGRGALAGLMLANGPEPEMALDAADHTLVLRTHGYAQRFGAVIERRLTLLAEGATLVGQDKIVVDTPELASGVMTLRFHLAPGASVQQAANEDLVRIRLGNGQAWTFLWEGAEMREEESVRQSSYFGFHRTRQLVLETPVEPDKEVAWIFTRDQMG